MFDDRGLMRRSPDIFRTVEHDLGFIRKEMIAVVQEIASVRASMQVMSSRKPGVSRGYVLTLGAVCLLLVSAVVVFQAELQSLAYRLGLHIVAKLP